MEQWKVLLNSGIAAMFSERGMAVLDDHCWESDQWSVTNENRPKLLTFSMAKMNLGKEMSKSESESLPMNVPFNTETLMKWCACYEILWRYINIIWYRVGNTVYPLSENRKANRSWGKLLLFHACTKCVWTVITLQLTHYEVAR